MTKTPRYSHSDVVYAALDAGLTWDEAEDIAFEVCPEYRTAHVAKVVRAIQARRVARGLSDPNGKV